MRKRSFFLAVAAGLLACSFGSMNATATTVPVFQDAGTYNFTLTSNGAGQLTISYTDVLLTQINGPVSPAITATLATATIDVTTTVSTPPLTSYTLSQPTAGVKSFGTDALQTATLNYAMASGFAVNPGFLNLVGSVTGVPAPLLETTSTSPTIYDFSPFGTGSNVMTMTFNEAGANFASVIANGGTIVGTGGFSEIAVSAIPEPSSFALLGIGVTAFLAYRRVFKRTFVA
jgi:PEP-CTERM motif